jgi:hypothetical protein
MFSNAKVGDRVWSFIHGWGVIIKVGRSSDFPIYAEFSTANDDGYESYSYEGRSLLSDYHPTLFWDEINFTIPSKPKAKWKLINGVKIPNITITPTLGSYYYFPYVSNGTVVVCNVRFDNDANDQARVSNGLCYPFTNEAKAIAILHAEAMLKYELIEE